MNKFSLITLNKINWQTKHRWNNKDNKNISKIKNKFFKIITIEAFKKKNFKQKKLNVDFIIIQEKFANMNKTQKNTSINTKMIKINKVPKKKFAKNRFKRNLYTLWKKLNYKHPNKIINSSNSKNITKNNQITKLHIYQINIKQIKLTMSN